MFGVGECDVSSILLPHKDDDLYAVTEHV